MTKISSLIIEDELRNQKLLSQMLVNYCPEIIIAGMAESVSDAIKSINELKPEIIFLDIQLKDGNGFEVLNAFHEEKRPKVIFTTAFDKYAIDAFKYSAVNYLLKPIDKDELIASVEKAIKIRKKEEITLVSNLLDKMMSKKSEQMISVSGPSSIEFIKISDIIHIKAMGAYSKIILKDGRSHTVSKVIKTYDEMLKDFDFYRIHQSHLINLHCVKKLNKGDSSVILENGDEVSIARNRKESFLKVMDQMIL